VHVRRQQVEPPVPGGAGSEPLAPTTPPAPSPADVRQSPEYLTLLEQNRQLAREAGSARAEAERARQAEVARAQAEEAARLEAQRAQVEAELGAAGVALFNEMAALSATDPVAAARKAKELGAMFGNQPPATPPPAPAATPPAAPAATPPPPSMGIDPSAPLGTPTGQDEYGPRIAANQAEFDATVTRQQGLQTRNQVSERDRSNGIMAFLLGAYTKAEQAGLVRPKR
jgi:hypothetical protein